jgi:hypothetical protein
MSHGEAKPPSHPSHAAASGPSTTPNGGANTPSGRNDKLAEEILQAQQSRSDLLKWKLVLTAALGAAGFGFGLGKDVTSSPLLLALIPFACVYVDLLCYNLSMRQLVIGAFFRKNGNDYEEYVGTHRKVFGLEDLALRGSTVTVCIMLLLVGVALLRCAPKPAAPSGPVQAGMTSSSGSPATQATTQSTAGNSENDTADNRLWLEPEVQGRIILFTGFLGLAGSWWTRRRFKALRKRLSPATVH